MADDTGAFADFDAVLASEDLESSPWGADGRYQPKLDLLRRLMELQVNEGYGRKQRSGRVAKSVDAWIAHELRRAGFPENGVWPRAKSPRVLPADLAPVEDAVALALHRLDEFSDRLDRWSSKATAKGAKGTPPSLVNLRSAINKITTTGKSAAFPGHSATNILGRFYVKQIDVAVSSWEHGPDVLVSTKTQFSSYLNNKNNRYEEAVGEATNLRDRHPMAAMGFVYIVRTNVYEERFAFAYLRDLLVRLRRPDGPFDATMLLAADWVDPWDGAKKEDRDPSAMPTFNSVEPTSPLLSPERFFDDLIRAVTTNTPVDRHAGVRERLPDEETPGGLPPEEAALLEDVDAALQEDA